MRARYEHTVMKELIGSAKANNVVLSRLPATTRKGGKKLNSWTGYTSIAGRPTVACQGLNTGSMTHFTFHIYGCGTANDSGVKVTKYENDTGVGARFYYSTAFAYWGNTDWTKRTAEFSTSTAPYDEVQNLVVAIDCAADTGFCVCNGKYVSAPTLMSGTAQTAVRNHRENALFGDNSIDGGVACFTIWDRMLSLEEAWMIHNDPWCVVEAG
jgi:hypothetical protein